MIILQDFGLLVLLFAAASSMANAQFSFSSGDERILTGGGGGGGGGGVGGAVNFDNGDRATFKFCQRDERERGKLSCYCDAVSKDGVSKAIDKPNHFSKRRTS